MHSYLQCTYTYMYKCIHVACFLILKMGICTVHVQVSLANICLFVWAIYGWVGYFTFLFFLISLS